MLISDEDMRALARVEGVREVALADCILGYDDSEPFVTYLRRVKACTDPNNEREFKPHWFAAPAPETTEHALFFSLSAQAAYCKEHGEAATRELLATEGLKLGQVKKAAPVDPADKIKGSTNPYSDEFKGTPAEREARISSLIKQGGTRLASQLAKAAGKSITNQPLQPTGAARMQR